MTVVVRDRTGKAVSRSRNLRGLRTRLGGKIWSKALVERVRIFRFPDGSGNLFIRFYDGDYCNCRFGDFIVLCGALRNWRNLYGADLYYGGSKWLGRIAHDNLYLYNWVHQSYQKGVKP